jgi:hypothetical protein
MNLFTKYIYSKIVFLVVLSSIFQYELTKIALKLYLRATLFLFISFLAVNKVNSNSLTASIINYHTQNRDTTKKNNTDTLSLRSDTLARKSSSPIDAPIFKDAKDSILYSLDGKKVLLWGEAIVKYQKMELTAAYIEYDMEEGVVFARGVADSTGAVAGKPIFKEGNQTFRMESMRYNFNTKKAKIYGVITKEADGYLHSKENKLMPDKTVNVLEGKYTTCDLDHPHFYIAITKAKVIPNNKIITGPAYLVIEDVPFPLLLPFGFFPSKQGRSSGIVFPKFGEERTRGFYMQDGGFYLGLSEYFDLQATGSIFSKGSWTSKIASSYKLRYKFSGRFSFDLANNVSGDKGSKDYFKSKTYSLRWDHSQDPKSNPNSTFRASVNFSSPLHNRFNAETVNSFLSNQLQSGITYSKVWPGTPFSLTASMDHRQNNRDSSITIGFPKVALNMSLIYPFKQKNKVGKPAWYEKIGFSYSSNLDNSVTTRTDSLFTMKTFDRMRNGMQHRIPLSTSFNILNYITIGPSVSYSENWYLETIEKRWDSEKKKVVVEEVDGFKRAWQYNAAVSASTRIYGMFNFKSTSKVQAIRHMMSPSISLGYRPDLSDPKYGIWKQVQIDTTGKKFSDYSIFEKSLYGGPGAGKSGNIGFNLGNTLEMKILSSKDTTTNTRKIKLLEGLNFGTSYNMLADSMQWSPVSFTARTTLFEKFNISFNSALDPYAIDAKGNRYNEFEFLNSKKFFRLTTASLGISFSLSGGKRSDTSGKSPGSLPRGQEGPNPSLDPTANPNTTKFGESIGAGFDSENIDFEVPWSLNVNYSYSYSKQKFEPYTSQTLSLSGDVSFTPKWKMGFSTGYDFKNNKLTTTSLNFFRDLHCWEMSLSVIPIGYLRSFSFKINVRSSTLQDLKLTRRQSYYDR